MNSFCIQCKSYLCILIPTEKAMSERNLETEKHISIPQESGEDVLAMNTC